MMASDEISHTSFSSRLGKSFSRIASMYLDRTTVYLKTRWLFSVLLIALFVLRIYLAEGFYIITYGLGIYLLNLLIGFLTPKIDPESEEGFVLPVRDSEEYRPFQRRLPEFKFWLSLTKALLVALGMTMFRVFDLPVFWPILLVYFLFLFTVTMKRQLRHMIKHKYIPLSWGKQTYGNITRSHGPIPSTATVDKTVLMQQQQQMQTHAMHQARGVTNPTRVQRM
eukprot:Selendium_serpulae@DN407_c0_g1_i2.p1